MQHLPERTSVNRGRPHRDRRLDVYQTELTQVSQEDPDDAERQVNVGGDIYHCYRCLRELQHREVLRTKRGRVPDPGPGRVYRGDQVERLTGGTGSSLS